MEDLFENLVYSEEDIITFPDGIPGFDDFTQYVIAKPEDHAPFEWLVSIKDKSLRFVIINPLLVDEKYNPNLSKDQLSCLNFENDKEIGLYVIVTLKDNLSESTANMIGPIFINTTTRQAKQIVLDDKDLSVRHPVLGGQA